MRLQVRLVKRQTHSSEIPIMARKKAGGKAAEIALIGEVDDWEQDVVTALLDVPEGGECTLFIDCAGGSVYGALAVATLILHRKLTCTGIVLGECSSACLLVLAACKKRQVTPYSTLLFHAMRWQSEKRVGAGEAGLWAKHFEELEAQLDLLQERLFGTSPELLRDWIRASRYVTGAQMVEAGLAEMLPL